MLLRRHKLNAELETKKKDEDLSDAVVLDEQEEEVVEGQKVDIVDEQEYDGVDVVDNASDDENEQSIKPLDEMDLEELKEYASQKEIEIGNASTVKGILKKIQESEMEE